MKMIYQRDDLTLDEKEDREREAYHDRKTNRDSASYIGTTRVGFERGDFALQGLYHINTIFKRFGTHFPREQFIEWRGGRDVYRIVFHCSEHPDMGQMPTLQQAIVGTLMGAFLQAGFSVSTNKYATEVVIPDTEENLIRWAKTCAEIVNALPPEGLVTEDDLLNFTPEFR